MNIIEKCSIGGMPFLLTSEAEKILEEYLTKIRAHYESDESGAEIVEGIEERLAELLQDKCGADKVVSDAEIDEVIKIMGFPEDMDGEDKKSNSAKKVKRLYRDPKTGIIGGVCSGLAGYFGVDVVFVRLLFTGLFALSFLAHDGIVATMPIIYLVMLIVMPVAKTVRERWAIKGDNGSVGKVEKLVKSGDETLKTASRSQVWGKLWNTLSYIIGILMIVAGVAGLAALIVGAFAGHSELLCGYDMLSCNEEVRAILFGSQWMIPAIFALFAIPCIGLLLSGIMLCFKLRAPKWHPGLLLFIIWIIIAAAFAAKFFLSLIPRIV